MSSLAYPPNVDGLLMFLDAARDALQRRHIRVRVVGFGAPATLERRLLAEESVDYLGFVDNLVESADGVAAAIVPLWSGAGVKLKTVTLLSMGIPVIATPVAMEGISADAALLIAETPADFARVVDQFDSLRPHLTSAGANGARIAASDHSTEALKASVSEQLRTLTEELA